jgi:prevent-host-death family protein
MMHRLPDPPESDNLIPVRDISATDAARSFSEVLDEVEHRGESFIVMRRGRPVARIVPTPSGSGRALKDLLLGATVDRGWADDVAAARALVTAEERPWDD